MTLSLAARFQTLLRSFGDTPAMGRYDTIDYPRYAKLTFLLGVATFSVGAVGSLLGHGALGSLPAWEETLLFDLEIVGILTALLGPLVFGVVMPLTE